MQEQGRVFQTSIPDISDWKINGENSSRRDAGIPDKEQTIIRQPAWV